jgi:tetratricopeptide (TPR) repeat protein
MAPPHPDSAYPDPALVDRLPVDRFSADRRSVTARRQDAVAWRAFRAQPVPGQRLFGLLRSLPGTDHGSDGLCAAMAIPHVEVVALLHALDDSGLIERARTATDDRYRVTTIGAALRPEWSGAETRSIQRWFDWCLVHVTAAAELLYPQALRLDVGASTAIPLVALPTAACASAWLNAEIDNLRSAIHSARGLGLDRFAWLLADALRGRAWQDPYRMNWIDCADDAVAAANATGGPREMAAAYLCLADACFLAGALDRAEDACTALGLNAARAGWLSGCAAGYANRGGINHRRGRLDKALDDYAHALELSVAAGRTATQATLYNNIATIHTAQGELGQAVTLHRRALVIFRQVGSLAGEARTLELLAQAWASADRSEAAQRALLQAFMVYGRLGDRAGEARTRAKVGEVSTRRRAA